MNNDLMFSSKTGVWETPTTLFSILNMEFNFKYDLAALKDNTKCLRYITPEQDSFTVKWSSLTDGYMWINPPYGKGMYKWIEKCYNESKDGAKIVALLPARTDTKWFHDFIYNKHSIRFLKGRLKFGNAKNAAPFPSMLVIFNN